MQSTAAEIHELQSRRRIVRRALRRKSSEILAARELALAQDVQSLAWEFVDCLPRMASARKIELVK
jgi:hypothetical protein